MEQQITKILKTDSTSAERLEGYHQIIKILQEEKEIPTSLLTNVTAIFLQLKEDITCDHVKISQDALYFLGVLLSQPMIVSSVQSERVGDIIKDICSVIKTTSEKAVCTRALWCLMKQRMPMDIYLNKLTDILHSLEYASQMFSKTSISVEIEAIRVLNRLIAELPEALAIRSGMWARRLYFATLHQNHKVREVALATLIAACPCLGMQQCELLSRLISDLKESIVPEMLKLFKEKQELHVLKLWNVLLDLLGKTLHQGATLINNLLTVVEKAFKSPILEVKIAAFKCWQHLIDNFGAEIDVLANPKRLRLVMQPLKANNARAESIAHVKFQVWWHLCFCLGPKLTTNMEMVVNPLIQLCFGLNEASSNQLNSSTNGVNSSPGGMHTFPSVHRLGCEALAQLLGHGQTLSITQPTLTIETLTHPVLTSSSIFLKHSNLLLSALKEGIARLSGDKKDLHLQLFLWHSMSAQIRTISETENIKEVSDVLSTFFTILEDFVKANNPSSEVVLKLVEITTSLPPRILTSSALNISSASVMNGTPALLFVTLLFNPTFLKSCSSQERFISVFQKLVSLGISVNTSALSFIHSAIKLLDVATPHVELSEFLYQLWGIIVFPLIEFVQKNQEVNQGDALEHDFSCLYATLVYPVQHLFKRPLLQNSFKTLVRTWTDLYRTFSSCAALVPNTEGNICCEEFSSHVYSFLSPSDLEDLLLLDYLSQILLIVVNTVNFNPASLQDPLTATANILTASPSVRMKRKQKPLGNLTAFIRLVKDVIQAVVVLPETSSLDKSLHFKVTGIVIDIVQHMYSHLTVSKLIGAVTTNLSSPISKLFLEALKTDLGKVQQGHLMTKLESMWNAIANCIQMNFNGPYDTDFLIAVSPLLEETLVYPRKNIRVKSRSFWVSGFSQSYDTLNVSESLLNVLKKVKPPVLPGSIETDDDMDGAIASIGDEIENQSMDSEMVPSPQKINAPLHNKIDGQQFKVPFNEEKVESSTKKRPRLDEVDDKEFTKIVPEVKKRRLLTDHQKEVLSSRSVIPAMYNDLSQSQDIISITSQLLNDIESQEAAAIDAEQMDAVEAAVNVLVESASAAVNSSIDNEKKQEHDVITIASQDSVCDDDVFVIEVDQKKVVGNVLPDSNQAESGECVHENVSTVAESQSLLDLAPDSLIATVNDEKSFSGGEISEVNESEMQDVSETTSTMEPANGAELNAGPVLEEKTDEPIEPTSTVEGSTEPLKDETMSEIQKVLSSSAEMHVATPIASSTASVDAADGVELPMVVTDVEILEKVNDNEEPSERLMEIQQKENETEADAIDLDDVGAVESMSNDSKVTLPSLEVATEIDLCEADRDSDSSVEPEPCIMYSAPGTKGDESDADDLVQVNTYAEVYPLENATIPLASDEVPMDQDVQMEEAPSMEADLVTSSVIITDEQLVDEQMVEEQALEEQAVETSVPTSSVIITEDQLVTDEKDQMIYVVSDMPGTGLDDGTVGVLVDSGIEIEIAKDGSDVNEIPDPLKIEEIPNSSSLSDVKIEVDELVVEEKVVDGKADEKLIGLDPARRFHRRKRIYNPYRPEDQTLSFVAQGNTKTYSRDNFLMKHYVLRPEGDGMLGVMQKSPLINRMNRGGRLLDAATKKNLDAYEKMKYEQRRSFDKIEETDETERKSEQSLVTDSDNFLMSDIGNIYPDLSVQIRTSDFSPASSPSSGILKKRKLDFTSSSSTGSPIYRRRVSFADPLVQEEVEYSDWNKEQTKVTVNQCIELNTTDSITYTLSSTLNSEQQVTEAQCLPQTVEIASLPETSQSNEHASTPGLNEVVEVSEMRIVDGTDASTDNSEVITVQLYGNIAGSDVSEVTAAAMVPSTVEMENCQYQQMEISFEVDETKKDQGHIVFTEIPCSTSDVSINMNEAVVLASSQVACTEVVEKEDIEKDGILIDSQTMILKDIDPETQALVQLATTNEEISAEQYQTAEVFAEPPLEINGATIVDTSVNSSCLLAGDEMVVADVVNELDNAKIIDVPPSSEQFLPAVSADLEASAVLPQVQPPADTTPAVVECSTNNTDAVSATLAESSLHAKALDPNAILQLANNLFSNVTTNTIRRMPVTDIVYLQNQLCSMAATVASSLLSLSNPQANSAPNQE